MLPSTAQMIPYSKTKMFKDLVLDYLSNKPELKNIFEHEVSLKGIANAIENRKSFSTDRKKLVDVLMDWYKDSSSTLQQKNIQSLLSENTFTVCTAHQPNIFTGYLYFVYKILHIIKITEELNLQFSDKHFVPVFFMGSEDNDLEELGQFKVDGVKKIWKTNQKGSVGRMLVDQGLIQIIAELEGQLTVHPFGAELIKKLRDCYRVGESIAQATFRFVNFLFEKYGLLVLVADDRRFKISMTEIFKDDIVSHTPYKMVMETGKFLMKHYQMQVNPREINLFYLIENVRERIIEKGDLYFIESNEKSWTRNELLHELENYPERFSPNVVLRAMFQEVILPNVAFVGGGAEVAYWLELKNMMKHYQVPYPVIILRNSFLLSSKAIASKIKNLGFQLEDLFMDIHELMQRLIKFHATYDIDLSIEKSKLHNILEGISLKNKVIDQSLIQHVQAVQSKVLKVMDNIEKKMIRAAKRKYQDQQRQLENFKEKLFPGNHLQERVDNILYYYALYGPEIIDVIYKHSTSFDQQFCIITVNQ